MNPRQRAIYNAVCARHGRPGYRGAPMRCLPSHAELAGTEPRREDAATDGRVIFDSDAQARAAIAELHAHGANLQETYQCGRSRSGHWHIRTAPTAATGLGQDGDPRA